MDAERVPKGDKLDAETQPKSMPKYVSTNIMFFRMVKSFKIIVKTRVCEGLAG